MDQCNRLCSGTEFSHLRGSLGREVKFYLWVLYEDKPSPADSEKTAPSFFNTGPLGSNMLPVSFLQEGEKIDQ